MNFAEGEPSSAFRRHPCTSECTSASLAPGYCQDWLFPVAIQVSWRELWPVCHSFPWTAITLVCEWTIPPPATPKTWASDSSGRQGMKTDLPIRNERCLANSLQCQFSDIASNINGYTMICDGTSIHLPLWPVKMQAFNIIGRGEKITLPSRWSLFATGLIDLWDTGRRVEVDRASLPGLSQLRATKAAVRFHQEIGNILSTRNSPATHAVVAG